MKTLTNPNVLRERSWWKVDNIFDNCAGQNNNLGLLLFPYLIECSYFKAVEFAFLFFRHTKNACDNLFQWNYAQYECISMALRVLAHFKTLSGCHQWCSSTSTSIGQVCPVFQISPCIHFSQLCRILYEVLDGVMFSRQGTRIFEKTIT